MVNYIVIGVLLFFAALCKAICDTLAYHFDTSVFKGVNDQWLDARKSWNNKNTWSKNKFVTLLLRNWLVFITDGWHFFGMVERVLFFTCIAFPITWYFIPLYFIGFISVFHIFFTYAFVKRNKLV